MRIFLGILGFTIACSSPQMTPDASLDGSTDMEGGANDGGPDVKESGTDASGCSGTCPKVLAARKIFFGESDRNFMVSTTAWRDFGLDIDGKTTTAQSTDVCKRQVGAPSSIQVDGTNGIDNSFGANFIPVIQSALSIPALSKPASDAIEKGQSSTFVLRADGLGTAMDYPMLPGSAYVGLPEVVPMWMGMDTWRASSRSVTMNDVSKPLAVFPQGAMAARVYTSGSSQTAAVIGLSFAGLSLMVPVRKLFVRTTIAADNSTASGVIGGVMNTEDFIATLKVAVGYISMSLCGAAFDGIAQQIRQMSDILDDGTQDPMQTCNGMTIGLGFEAAAALLDGVVADPAPANPCP